MKKVTVSGRVGRGVWWWCAGGGSENGGRGGWGWCDTSLENVLV